MRLSGTDGLSYVTLDSYVEGGVREQKPPVLGKKSEKWGNSFYDREYMDVSTFYSRSEPKVIS